MNTPKPPQPRLPIFMLVFVSMFGLIGVALLVFLWSQSSHEFGAPPLVFRLVGSCIAIAFIAVGFGVPLTALRARSAAGVTNGSSRPESAPASGDGYKCPHCGAGLGQNQEVSPSGDVKCGYCNKWWNIHR